MAPQRPGPTRASRRTTRASYTTSGDAALWLLLTRLNCTLDIQEDYAPWAYVSELREGHITWSSSDREDLDHEVRWLSGDERQSAWLRYGIVEDVGIYLGRMLRG